MTLTKMADNIGIPEIHSLAHLPCHIALLFDLIKKSIPSAIIFSSPKQIPGYILVEIYRLKTFWQL